MSAIILTILCSDVHCKFGIECHYIDLHVVMFTAKCSERHYLKLVSIVAEHFTTNVLRCFLKSSILFA